MSTPTNPLLPHLEPIRRAAEVRTFKTAALWVLDSLRTMQSDSTEAGWARGAAQFLWQMADETDGLFSPWRSDIWVPQEAGGPVIVGRRGTDLFAIAVYSHASEWRHHETSLNVWFDPDVWQPLPRPP